MGKISSLLPGGVPQLRSDFILSPLFSGIPGLKLLRSIEYFTQPLGDGSEQIESNQRTEISRYVVDDRELLEEVREVFVSYPIDYKLQRLQNLTLMYYYTPAYQAAKAAFEDYIKSVSCYNSNLTNPDTDEKPSDTTFWLMQWANFPFMEFSESINKKVLEGVPFHDYDASRVTIKVYVYDLAAGAQLAEIQYEYIFFPQDTEAESIPDYSEGGNLYNKYASLIAADFGEERKFGAYKIALKRFDATRYIPLTTRTTRVDKTTIENVGTPFSTEKDGVVTPAKTILKTTTETTVNSGPVPTLSRQNIPDSQARLGRLAGGDVAAQLTARKIGEAITSTTVAAIVSGAVDGRNSLIAETTFYQFGGSLTLDNLESLVGDVFAEVDGAESQIVRKTAAATGTKTARVVMVISLYKIRYEVSDAAVLAGFVDNYEAVISEYENQIETFLKLLACQRSLNYNVVAFIWSQKLLTAESAITKWLDNMRRASNGIVPYDADISLTAYNIYVDFRRKISYQDALRATYIRDRKLLNYSQVSMATIQYVEELIVGDQLELLSARDNVSGSVVGASTTITSRSITGNVELVLP